MTMHPRTGEESASWARRTTSLYQPGKSSAWGVIDETKRVVDCFAFAAVSVLRVCVSGSRGCRGARNPTSERRAATSLAGCSVAESRVVEHHVPRARRAITRLQVRD